MLNTTGPLDEVIRAARNLEGRVNAVLTGEDAASDALTAVFDGRRFTAISRGFVKLLGVDARGLDYSTFLHPHDRAPTLAVAQAGQEPPPGVEPGSVDASPPKGWFLNRYRVAGGSYRWILWFVTRAALRSDGAVEFVAHAVDVDDCPFLKGACQEIAEKNAEAYVHQSR